MTYKEAAKSSMEKLATLPNTIFIGYNLKYGSKAYGTLSNVNPDKIIEMPVAEQLMAGVSTGMALRGYLPIIIFERHDFLLLATDQFLNHLDKLNLMSRGEYNPRVIIRAIVGGTKPFYPGPQHVQNFCKLFQTHSSFTIYEPKTSQELTDAFSAAVTDKNSVFISEERNLYDNN